jgi:hypothetical protein
MFNKKITEIIKGLFGPKKSTKYFTTISGSKTLAMLASFKFGQTILKDIITTPGIPINIASYTKENNERENVLTVLTEKDRDDLFSVFFNRVLTDSYNEGPGNLSAVMDALVYLQSRETPGIFFFFFSVIYLFYNNVNTIIQNFYLTMSRNSHIFL